jgi:hypothetical protein
MEVSGYLHTPAAFTPRMNRDTHLVGGWGGTQSRYGSFGEEKNLPGFEPRTIQPVA